jgi:hypothetical protein
MERNTLRKLTGVLLIVTPILLNLFIQRVQVARPIDKISAVTELIDVANYPPIGDSFYNGIADFLSKRIGKSFSTNNQKRPRFLIEIGYLWSERLGDLAGIVLGSYNLVGRNKKILTL